MSTVSLSSLNVATPSACSLSNNLVTFASESDADSATRPLSTHLTSASEATRSVFLTMQSVRMILPVDLRTDTELCQKLFRTVHMIEKLVDEGLFRSNGMSEHAATDSTLSYVMAVQGKHRIAMFPWLSKSHYEGVYKQMRRSWNVTTHCPVAALQASVGYIRGLEREYHLYLGLYEKCSLRLPEPQGLLRFSTSAILLLELFDDDLLHLTRDQHISSRALLDITVQLAEGVYMLHNEQIVHRELGVENILVKDGRVVLGSLSLCQTTDIEAKSIGTAFALPPEMLFACAVFKTAGRAFPVFSRNLLEADIWAIGMIFLHLITREKSRSRMAVCIEKLLDRPLNAGGLIFYERQMHRCILECIDEIPSDWDNSSLIRRLLQITRSTLAFDPAKRPTAEWIFNQLMQIRETTLSTRE